MPRPVSVAITGGIGAGKSEALKAFAQHGAAVVSSDEIVHRLLQEDEEVRAALRERFGQDVFTNTGDVDRGAVALIVFRDRDELEWLEGMLHPRVVQEYLEWREEQAAKPQPPALTVTEVPLLYEVGGETRFDKVVAITADLELRAGRARVQVDGRDARLIPDEEKLRRADFAYVNDGSLAELDAFVAQVVQTLTA
ncbi:MAG TPA: dephospho-CoA kinase [Gaiellaceae bacterium]